MSIRCICPYSRYFNYLRCHYFVFHSHGDHWHFSGVWCEVKLFTCICKIECIALLLQFLLKWPLSIFVVLFFLEVCCSAEEEDGNCAYWFFLSFLLSWWCKFYFSRIWLKVMKNLLLNRCSNLVTPVSYRSWNVKGFLIDLEHRVEPQWGQSGRWVITVQYFIYT